MKTIGCDLMMGGFNGIFCAPWSAAESIIIKQEKIFAVEYVNKGLGADSAVLEYAVKPALLMRF
ncbi:MAG: hypothetical protein HQL28_00775 [Candidatus Omnitrophica bacterium]|nr:hypothetical protein [Candidatus Omnitrophota bacterium]